MRQEELRQQVIDCARQFEADIVCFGDRARFEHTRVMEIFPETRTVICLAFRVPRGVYRGIEEGSTYYQYTTNGVETLEETVMPRAALRVSAVLEDAGYAALPQRKYPLVMEGKTGHNVEVYYEEIYHGCVTEPAMDFEEAAVLCGLGEKGLSGSILTRAFGPFQRWCFVLTDASLEPTPLAADRLCDGCRACVAACPGHAVEESGGRDVWQCGAYYRGACRAKNPFMPPNAFADLPDREKVMSGEARLTREESIQVMNDCYYYPPIKQGYAPSICGRACDRACYVHLEEQGKIERTFRTAFRRRPEWSLSLKDE